MASSRIRHVFLTGATGYIGRHLVPELARRGHRIRALIRKGSEARLPREAEPVPGNALDRNTFAAAIPPCDTFVQLVGVAHPSPAKAAEFRDVDLVSVRESVAAATDSGVSHFIYLSVAQPAPVMKEYIAVRAEGERLILQSGMGATFIRPWYVLGPGHRWPYAILPLYWILLAVPGTRDTARRLYPVPLRSVIRAIADAVDAGAEGVRIVEAPQMRAGSSR